MLLLCLNLQRYDNNIEKCYLGFKIPSLIMDFDTQLQDYYNGTFIEKDSAKKTITIEINDGTTTKTAVINYVITTNVTITFVDNTL